MPSARCQVLKGGNSVSTELDSLEIRIQSDSQTAAAGIDKLEASLSRLKGTAKGGAGLTSTVNQINKLSSASEISCGSKAVFASQVAVVSDMQAHCLDRRGHRGKSKFLIIVLAEQNFIIVKLNNFLITFFNVIGVVGF